MTRIIRVAILETDTPIDPVLDRYGTYGAIFNRWLNKGLQGLGVTDTEIQTTNWDVVNQSVYPKLEDFDALLMTGSKHDAYADVPWMNELTKYVHDIHEQHKKPIIGICFGHQILARALGARVARNDEGWEVSVEPFQLSDTGKQLFSKESLNIHQMHTDIVYDVPPGFVNLGSSPRCKVQGLYMPQRVLTLQGHPEYDEFVTTELIKLRHAIGRFDDELAKDGLSRVGNQHDGELIARMANQIRTLSPATNKVIFEHPGTSLDEARAIAQASDNAFQSYKQLSLAERKAIIIKALNIVDANKETLANELTAQMGRPIAYCTKEIDTMRKRADYLLSIADDSLKNLPGQAESGFRRFLKKEPLGVTLISTAWNYPYLITVNTLLPALLAGNTVLLRTSPQTPLLGERLVSYFQEAGLPTNVLQLLHVGSLDVLDEIVKLPQIKLVSFTGSTAGGIRLREATARRVVPVNLELGGNDPAYVRPDADIAYVAAQVVDGAVFNSGQSCCSIERVYVHADVYDSFITEAQKELSTYKLGDPTDKNTTTGPVISKQSLKNIQSHIDDALSKGAIDSTPANATFTSLPAEGNYIAPKLLTNVTHDMVTMREETFGPVIPVMKVSSDEEAVALMNDSDYGLTASVWTKNIKAGEALIEKIDAGTVYINRCDYPSPDLAWIGWKNSGLGCTLGPHAFDGFYKLKSFHIKEEQS
ncbi:Aldehyde/histidinol dehydrogenase [Aspergillus pseudonomiae]|uniref:aldehyde dehydrogenase (NAD(+)) n=1 Tax=Aspergillus pseudonomiae TaxID=1506151 RepID=A0A5N6I3I4_9EURO|nr:Aldehyde/histidinol dehydrogenase [Aspergillus pseudonomiae]KAB8260329.1 Aldehyde/histidinol dehydrogenase [Aspergillus pseudonomiae]KAE8402366.1 Aldehyde/histidinol dehydrogenase [Aspergillus pseudonomiae]